MIASNTIVCIHCRDAKDDVALPLDTLLRLANVEGEAIEVELVVATSDGELSASVDLLDKYYPGMTLDGYDKDGNKLWLANADLPNEEDTKNIVARLYAGYSAREYDGPIAMATHDISNPPSGRAAMTHTAVPTKIVYVDTTVAQWRPWIEEGPVPEHVED